MLREEILNEFSPQNALEIEWELSRFNRAKGAIGFSKAVEVVRNVIGDSKVLKYPMNKLFDSWTTPSGWNPTGGFLRIADPRGYIVSDLGISPINSIFLSGPSNGVERLEVVDVGTGEEKSDYTGSVKGRAVLANGNVSRVYDLAVRKFGARCVLSSFMRAQVKEIGRTPESMPDAVNYTSFPPDSNGEAMGFAMSHSQYMKVKELLRSGKVEIEAKADIDTGTNELEVIEARFGRKTDGKPLVLTAHLCHPRPGANDNASGSALLAEIVRVLKKFDLNREVVALWVPEMYGTEAYLTDHLSDFEFGINLDMVGEDQCKTGSVLEVSSTPWSLPSFISELLFVNLKNPNFRMDTGRYSGGSDHYILCDSTIGVPSTSLTQWPDRYYHSSEDTPDKASVKSFGWIGKGVLDSIVDLAERMDDETGVEVAAKILEDFMIEYHNAKSETISNWMAVRAMKKLEGLSKYADVSEAVSMIEKYPDMTKVPEHSGIRKVRGPIADSWMKGADFEWGFRISGKVPQWYNFKDELLNFMEIGFGFREALELSAAEFGIKQDLTEDASHYLQRLKEEDLIDKSAEV